MNYVLGILDLRLVFSFLVPTVAMYHSCMDFSIGLGLAYFLAALVRTTIADVFDDVAATEQTVPV